MTDSIAIDAVRIDRWLYAVRLTKTRPLATGLCEGGPDIAPIRGERRPGKRLRRELERLRRT